MAPKPIFLFLFFFFLVSRFNSSNSQAWIKAAYWYSGAELPVSDVNSALFTHLLCSFAYINSSTYQLSINSSDVQSFSAFTDTVKRRNPSITTLLSIFVGRQGRYSSAFASMMNQSSHRKSFIDSSIRTARLYGFHGLDLREVMPSSQTNMTDLGTLFEDWRTALASESKDSGKPELLLVMTGHYLPALGSVTYPIGSISKNLNWVHVVAYDYYVPTVENLTGLHSALFGPQGRANTDQGIREWLSRGLPASKLVLGLPFHGYAWTLAHPEDDRRIEAPASGPAITIDGSMGYKLIKSFIQNYGYGSASVYNSTYVVNLFATGKTWINFDGLESIKAKVSYAKRKGLLGYCAFHLSNDDNWELSRAALGEDDDKQKKRKLLLIVLVIISMAILFLAALVCYQKRRALKSRGVVDTIRKTLFKLDMESSVAENLNNNGRDLQVFSLAAIKAATKNFSFETKLGEGGYGPVYKGKLHRGQEIAVKRLSKTSNQGQEEFKNEVTLTASLQHVNLVAVLGICTEKDEKMLIYEYMPNKSLDFYLFDPVRRCQLDWEKRVKIIEGVTQGLLYLQEYSNFTIIHRDLKASNILLDRDMKPKISDFGVARLFRKDEHEANTGRIVGTYGCVPPEYVKRGIYSMKYDVYSFGVLLLQIISGKRITGAYGCNENLNLSEFAYDLWRSGEGKELFDASLDDSSSSWKLMRCLQVALLCVQENPADRPSMVDVFTMLKHEPAAMKFPNRPAFSIKRDEEDEASRGTVGSVNDQTITQVVGR